MPGRKSGMSARDGNQEPFHMISSVSFNIADASASFRSPAGPGSGEEAPWP
jgi:hypothetical protein